MCSTLIFRWLASHLKTADTLASSSTACLPACSIPSLPTSTGQSVRFSTRRNPVFLFLLWLPSLEAKIFSRFTRSFWWQWAISYAYLSPSLIFELHPPNNKSLQKKSILRLYCDILMDGIVGSSVFSEIVLINNWKDNSFSASFRSEKLK